jgi:chromosome segregation ATPase
MVRFVTITCPNCPRELQIRREHVGRKVACKFCAGLFRIPTHVLIPCPKCGRDGNVRTEHLGRKIRCKSCAHAFRAKAKRAQGRTRADADVRRLMANLASRDAELAKLRALLAEARGEVANLDERARDLIDDRDTGQRTLEWSIIEDEPGASCSDLANGTEPDLPLADLDLDLDGVADRSESETRVVAMGGEPDLTRTRVASSDPDDELASLREERDRLRDELDTLRESAEQTVVTRDRTETLERDLHLARADNVRLVAEREEVGHAVDGLMVILRERDLALVEAARQRDESRAAFDLAESARLALADQLESLRREHPEIGIEDSTPVSNRAEE